MRSELKELQRRTGITFIYVTHDQAEAMALSDRIVVFNRGRVQQIGTPREVYERPANLFVADFMGLVNKLPGIVTAHGGGTLRVRIGSQEITAQGEAHGDAGEVTIAIRPEAIRFGAASDANMLAGTVTEATFLGNFIDYQVDVGGAVLRVQGSRWDSHPIGAAVALAIPATECFALPADEQEPKA
jgi:iron(III) transport system ATP-binding protein